MTQEIIEQLRKLNSKLDILIALQMVDEKPKNIRDKIKLLDELGAQTSEIASILRIKPGHASKERSLMKKKNGKKS